MVVKTRKKHHVKKNNTTTKTRRKLSACAPGNNEPSFSCYSKDALIKVIEHWNNNNNTNNRIYFNNRETKEVLWNKIDDKLQHQCEAEFCWSQLQTYPKQLRTELESYFKPVMPKKWLSHHKEWLNTLDLENVLNQYERKHKDFKSFGAVPIDFDYKHNDGECVIDELCNLNISDLMNKGKTKMSVIFNLDKHNQPGSHWIAMYADFNTGDINYFDSYGYDAPKEVCTLMKRIKKQLVDLNSRANIRVSKLRHQYKDSECGMYCLYFIISQLEGKTFSDLTKKQIPDDKMESNRDIYFVKYSNSKYLD